MKNEFAECEISYSGIQLLFFFFFDWVIRSLVIRLFYLSCPVLASFPLCDITEKDLTQNPQFCKLLATLTQHVDQTGLTVPLKTELDKVSADTVLTLGQNLGCLHKIQYYMT